MDVEDEAEIRRAVMELAGIMGEIIDSPDPSADDPKWNTAMAKLTFIQRTL